MGDIKGFLKVKRQTSAYRPVSERAKDYKDVCATCSDDISGAQASRCMDCGTPFCHWACPTTNFIPEWNDQLFKGHLKDAYQLLAATNNFPEITGRLCPALCEYSCVLGINDDPVTIRENELAIIEKAFKMGFVKPNPPKKRTGKTAAIVGSGPAGLACADQLNKAGHKVVVFERDKKIGGILRYGIPDFKLEKQIIDRRLKILEQEGVEFKVGINVGQDYPVSKLSNEFNAVCITTGSRIPHDMPIEGRDLKGIHFALDYLIQSNKRVSNEEFSGESIDARRKSVVVIGGGDTGSDCVGTANRQGALSVTQLEILQCPPECRNEQYPWPKYPLLLKTTSSHEEGAERQWSVLTKKFIGQNGKVTKLLCVKVEFERNSKGAPIMKELCGSEFEIYADLVLLALGFVYPQKEGLINELKLELDKRGSIKTDNDFMTSLKGVFAAGDARRGQSLVVWAINEGRTAAENIDKYLKSK